MMMAKKTVKLNKDDSVGDHTPPASATEAEGITKSPCPHEDCLHFVMFEVYPKEGNYRRVLDPLTGAWREKNPCRDCVHFVKFDFLTVEG